MKVKIDSPIGNKTYDLEETDVLKLLHNAWKLSCGTFEEDMSDDTQEEKTPPAPKHSAPVSRVERMFGKRETWAQHKDEPERQNGWKGFMLIRCPECGKVRSFFAKNRTTSELCSCGFEIELDNLLPAFVNCAKCGKRLKYRTNIRDDHPSTVNCIECKAPIDMQLNRKGTALVPVGHSRDGAY